MITATQKAKEMVGEMLASTDPNGKYPMCFDTAKECALKSVREIIRDCENNIATFPKYEPLFMSGLIWWKHVEQKIKVYVFGA